MRLCRYNEKFNTGTRRNSAANMLIEICWIDRLWKKKTRFMTLAFLSRVKHFHRTLASFPSPQTIDANNVINTSSVDAMRNSVDSARVTSPWLTHCFFIIFAIRQCRQRHYVFGLSVRRVRLFVRPDRSCYHDISWTAWAISMKRIWSIHYPLLISWLNSGGQRSKVKATSGRRGSEGVLKMCSSCQNGPVCSILKLKLAYWCI